MPNAAAESKLEAESVGWQSETACLESVYRGLPAAREVLRASTGPAIHKRNCVYLI